MPFRTPTFWYARPSLLSALLWPLSLVYRFFSYAFQEVQKPYAPVVPVICIGNTVVGGSGKTPASLALATLLQNAGLAKKVVFLTRGYGGKLAGPVVVQPDTHTHEDVGDEPLLLARGCTTVVARNRAMGAQMAEELGADLIIMDDGLQNGSIVRTVSFLVVDTVAGFGNGFVMPAGPLRERIEVSLNRVDAILNVGGGADLTEGKPAFNTHIEPTAAIPSGKLLAFAGLGRPEKFLHTLQKAGADVAGFHPFPDHHPYTDADMQKLTREAAEKNARLVTTAKDFVRVPHAFRDQVLVVSIEMKFDQADKLVAFIRERI